MVLMDDGHITVTKANQSYMLLVHVYVKLNFPKEITYMLNLNIPYPKRLNTY